MTKMEFVKDESGKEMLLKDGKFQVMMEWEKPYMEACIDALHPCGDVLEIGFGLGYSATRIQSYHPNSHTIVEFHPTVAQEARRFAAKHPGVRIVEDTWQQALSTLGVFDCIFFDDYPLYSEEEMKKMEESSASSHLLLEKGKKLIESVEKELPQLKTIRYSDADLAAFISGAAAPGAHLLRFLKELKAQDQITEEQLSKMLQLMLSSSRTTQEEIDHCFQAPLKKEPFALSGKGDRLFEFLSACLKSHMRIGSRFSCFLSSATSKFEDKRFFEEIITHPSLDYTEKVITLDVPENCSYYSGKEALVITLTKRA
jgi:hypothetical protein